MSVYHRGIASKRFRRSSFLRVLPLESRDVPSAIPNFGPQPIQISAVGSTSNYFHAENLPSDELVADPNLIATGPFNVPGAGGGFKLLDGGNAGDAYSPHPIVYSTSGNGMPLLNSAPSSPVAIYLDFDGHGSNTPYDNNGDAANFDLAEQQTIVEVWRQIAIYYAMFDVNVTTVQPVGVPMCWQLISNSISGGYAYVGAFPNTQPMGFNQGSDARNRVSGIAHEVGHNFILSHQSDYNQLGVKTAEYSSGYSLHGPIMGVDFAQLVHNFTNGHPSYSNSSLQDDFQLIANEIKAYQPPTGDGFRTDDVGNTIGTSLPLESTNGYFQGWGIIERLTDVDAFSFTTTGGLYGFYGNPNTPSSLDAKMEIFDSGGNRLATVDHPSNNEANIVMNLPAGTFYVMMSGHEDYADVGAYQLSVRPLPAGWATQDIGSLVTGGYAGIDPIDGVWRVGGSGSDIWGTSDNFRFAYTPLTGDGSITAQVTFVENTNASAKAGVMVRETLNSDSKNAFMLLNPTGASFQYRSSTGGTSTNVTGAGTAPYWVRITRTGNTLTGQRSSDGVTWNTVGTQSITMASQVYIGLAVTSHNNSHYNQVHDATFDDVSTTGATGPTIPSYNALPQPTGLALSLGTGTGIVINWNAVPGATGYEVYRSDDGVNWGSAVGTTGAGTTTFTHNSLTGGRRHFYRVHAMSGATRSVPSDVNSIINRPSAVTNFSVASVSTSQLVLNWRETGGETGYRIERSTDGGANWTSIATIGRNIPSYTNSSLGYATTYSYRVIPTSADGDGPASSIVTTSTRLNQVTGLAITSVTNNQIDLNWTAVTGATGYRIERSNDGSSFTTLTTVATPGHSDTGLTALAEYYYRVAAVNQYSESISYATVFAATSPTTLLPAPWLDQDIGSVGGKGSAGLISNTFTVIGSGGTIGSTSDAFHFLYQPLTGDGTLKAQTSTVENVGTSSFAGIMIRESLSANSRSFFLGIAPASASGVRWVTRTAAGANSTTTNVADVGLPEWLRLSRAGTTITAERSEDGNTWLAVGSVTVSMGATAYAGLAVVSGDNTRLNTSTISSVTLGQTNLPPAILQATPSGAVPGPVSAVDLTFTQAMDTTTFNVASDVISFTGPTGNAISQITSHSWFNGTTLRINLNSQSVSGTYALVLGPQILGTNGLPLNQDGDANPGEPVEDRFTANWTIGKATDAFGYAYQPIEFDSSLNLVPGATGVFTLSALSSVDDANSVLDLGTNKFRFYGIEYTGNNQLFIGSNGLVTFGSGSNEYLNDDMTSKLPQQSIAALWDDIVTLRNTATDDLVLYQFQSTIGDATPERLVINWRNVHYWQQSYTSGDDGITFQLVLELNTGARSGDMILNYNDLSETGSGGLNNGGSASVGIKDVGTQGDSRVLISQDGSGSSLVASNKAVRIFVNRPPVAEAGGPYDTPANGNVVLSGLASSDPDQSSASLTYLWDLDGDGVLGETGAAAIRGDEIGATPTFKGLGLSAPSTVILRVIDEFGRQTDDSATINPPPARVTGVIVNDGSAQRSRINYLAMTFDRIVTLPSDVSTAFSLISDTGSVFFVPVVGLTGGFTTVEFVFAHLADGNYQLTAFANLISAAGQELDGDNDGVAGGNYVFDFHRLFGDGDGDRDVDSDDFAAFRTVFGTPSFGFDSNGDGNVGAEDFAEFRRRYGITLAP